MFLPAQRAQNRPSDRPHPRTEEDITQEPTARGAEETRRVVRVAVFAAGSGRWSSTGADTFTVTVVAVIMLVMMVVFLVAAVGAGR